MSESTYGWPHINYSLFDFRDKERALSVYVNYMLNRVQSMIRYEGLPDTIPERDLRLLLQTRGFAAIPDPDLTGGEFYATFASLAGPLNPYYMPTICIVANPYLPGVVDKSMTLEINKDVAIIPHDSLYQGLLPIFRRYGTMLVENDITLLLLNINGRQQTLISAPDDPTRKSAEDFIKSIGEGKPGVVAESAFFDGIKTSPLTVTGDQVTPLIELHQYLIGGWYNEIGINAAYNMKREAINEAEAALNTDALIPLVDDILETQSKAFENVNRMFGTNISVHLNSAWEKTAVENSVENAENDPEEQPEESKEGADNADN